MTSFVGYFPTLKWLSYVNYDLLFSELGGSSSVANNEHITNDEYFISSKQIINDRDIYGSKTDGDRGETEENARSHGNTVGEKC